MKGGDIINYISIEDFNENNFDKVSNIPNYSKFDEIDIEKLLEKNIKLLEKNLILIGRQVTFNETNDAIDLLALNKNGDLVIIDVKSCLIPTTSDFQMLKYAAFVQNWTTEDIKEQINFYYNIQNNYNKNVNLLLKSFFDDYSQVKLNQKQIMKVAGIKENKKINSVVNFLNSYNINFDLYKIIFKKLHNYIIINTKKIYISKNNIYITSPELTSNNKKRHLANCTTENIEFIEAFNEFLQTEFNVELDWSKQSYISVTKNNNRFLEYHINANSIRVQIARDYFNIIDKNLIYKKLSESLSRNINEHLMFKN